MKIDTTIIPKLPFTEATIESNDTSMGVVDFKPENFELYLDPGQQDGEYITGDKLRKIVAKKNPVNAAFMDYLEAHPELVPDSWKKDEQDRPRYIYAWGTIFRSSGGSLYVRYWYWSDGELVSVYDWLGYDWDGRRPALVPASAQVLGSSTQDFSALALERAIEIVKEAGYQVAKIV